MSSSDISMLLRALADRGVTVDLEGDNLRLTSQTTVSEADIALVRAHKAELFEALVLAPPGDDEDPASEPLVDEPAAEPVAADRASESDVAPSRTATGAADVLGDDERATPAPEPVVSAPGIPRQVRIDVMQRQRERDARKRGIPIEPPEEYNLLNRHPDSWIQEERYPRPAPSVTDWDPFKG